MGGVICLGAIVEARAKLRQALERAEMLDEPGGTTFSRFGLRLLIEEDLQAARKALREACPEPRADLDGGERRG